MAKCIQQDGEFSCLEAELVKCWKSDYAIYEIEISCRQSNVSWTVSKRYREFAQLHDSLCKLDPAIKDIRFPPKKPFNNLSSKFLRQRLAELQTYLNAVLRRLPMPPVPLAQFIDWNVYEIHGITDLLARSFYDNGDVILKLGFPFELTVLQIFAINQRLHSQSPTNLFDNPNTDFVHVMEFIGQVRNVKVTGSTSVLHSSNIVMNKYELDMSRFNSIEKLELVNIDLRQMRGFDKLKDTVRFLKVSHSLDSIKILALGDLLSIGNGDWVFGRDSVPTNCWRLVETLDLSSNYLHGLDPSMALFRRARTVKLNHNLLVDVQHLEILDNLRVLNLSHNKLGLVYISTNRFPEPTLRGRLGNITELDISYNQLVSTRLIEGLYSLVKLNFGSNLVEELEELTSLASLQCLESLILLGNPVCSRLGYRRFTLQLFPDRFSEMKLDLRVPDETECAQLHLSMSLESPCPLDQNGASSSTNSVIRRGKTLTECAMSDFSNSAVECGNLEVSIESEVNEIFIF